MKPAPLTYNWLARQLHWFTAALIVFLFLLGLTMTALPLSELRLNMVTWHKWLGLTLLGLIAFRLIWRLATSQPELKNPAIPHMMETAAKAGHLALYLLLLMTPMLGWLYSSAAGFEIVLFETFRLPDLVNKNKELADQLALYHEIAAWSLIALVAGHIGAVIIHHKRYHDPILKRMKPSLLHITLLSGALLLGGALFFNYRFINPPAHAPDANEIERTEKVSAKSPDEVKEEDKVRDKSVWQIDRGASQLQFTATQKSAATTGNFKLFKLNSLRFDAANPENANVSIEVDISSIELGNTLIEQTLLAKDWFDVKSHPSARFSATGFTHKGEDRYQLQGELTINGITTPQPVELVIMSDEEGESGKRITAEGTAIISRTKFGIGQGEWASTETLKDEVTLKIKVTATKPQ